MRWQTREKSTHSWRTLSRFKAVLKVGSREESTRNCSIKSFAMKMRNKGSKMISWWNNGKSNRKQRGCRNRLTKEMNYSWWRSSERTALPPRYRGPLEDTIASRNLGSILQISTYKCTIMRKPSKPTQICHSKSQILAHRRYRKYLCRKSISTARSTSAIANSGFW